MRHPYDQEQLARYHHQDLLQEAARRRTFALAAGPSFRERLTALIARQAAARRQPRVEAAPRSA